MKTTNTTASVTNQKVNPEQNRLIAAIINGVQNESQQEQTQSTITRYPKTGSRPTVVANYTSDNKSEGNNGISIITHE